MQPSAYAFFDVDDTVIKTKSMFSFFTYWCEDWINDAVLLSRFVSHFEQARSSGTPREKMNRDYYRFFSGVDPKILSIAGEAWSSRLIANGLFFAPTLAKMCHLREQGVAPVFVSGSFAAVLNPIAQHLKVDHILAANMKVGKNGLYDGEIGDPQTIGVGKAVAVQNFLSERGIAPSECWALGDDVSDVPMLECVGHPLAVGSSSELSAIAHDRSWPVLSLEAQTAASEVAFSLGWDEIGGQSQPPASTGD